MQSRLYYFKWTKPWPTLLRNSIVLLDTLSELPSRKSLTPIIKSHLINQQGFDVEFGEYLGIHTN